jgi:hypothetical protein
MIKNPPKRAALKNWDMRISPYHTPTRRYQAAIPTPTMDVRDAANFARLGSVGSIPIILSSSIVT